MQTGYEIDVKAPLKVQVNGQEYDVTRFKNYHPGGHFIMHQYEDKDATDVFKAFHGPDAYEKLKNMTPLGPVAQANDPVMNNFQYASPLILERDGWFKQNYAWAAWKFFSTVGLVVAGCYAVFAGYWLIGAIILGVGYQQLGWLGHDICHHNFTPYRKLNNILAYFIGNFLNGFSVNWWKNRHNTHHAITNVLDSDPDVDNLPLFIWDVTELTKASQHWFASAIVSYQEYYFIPWTTTLKMIWCIQSIVFLVQHHIQNQSFLRALKWEALTLALHWTWVLFVAWHTPTWAAFFGFLLISEAVGGSGIALIVFMNHYALDLHPQENRLVPSFVDLQLKGSRNIIPNQINNWISGGLNLQIEHHLFPRMPRNNLYNVRPLVKKFCKDNGIEYQELNYWDCLMEVERKLQRVSAAYIKMVKKTA